MKHARLVLLSTLIIASLAIAGCFYPAITPIPDPIEPDDPVAIALTLPVAVFTYLSAPTIQTSSWVAFDGSDSYDPDDHIMRGEWDFDGEKVITGIWATLEETMQNGKLVWIWKANAAMQLVNYKFKQAKTYTVRLTVWDYDGNQDSVTRKVVVE